MGSMHSSKHVSSIHYVSAELLFQPAVLEPDVPYTIVVETDSSEYTSRYSMSQIITGAKALKDPCSMDSHGVSFTFASSPLCTTDTSGVGGQIPAILFFDPEAHAKTGQVEQQLFGASVGDALAAPLPSSIVSSTPCSVCSTLVGQHRRQLPQERCMPRACRDGVARCPVKQFLEPFLRRCVRGVLSCPGNFEHLAC